MGQVTTPLNLLGEKLTINLISLPFTGCIGELLQKRDLEPLPDLPQRLTDVITNCVEFCMNYHSSILSIKELIGRDFTEYKLTSILLPLGNETQFNQNTSSQARLKRLLDMLSCQAWCDRQTTQTNSVTQPLRGFVSKACMAAPALCKACAPFLP